MEKNKFVKISIILGIICLVLVVYAFNQERNLKDLQKENSDLGGWYSTQLTNATDYVSEYQNIFKNMNSCAYNCTGKKNNTIFNSQ